MHVSVFDKQLERQATQQMSLAVLGAPDSIRQTVGWYWPHARRKINEYKPVVWLALYVI
jgi:hypothetical protein